MAIYENYTETIEQNEDIQLVLTQKFQELANDADIFSNKEKLSKEIESVEFTDGDIANLTVQDRLALCIYQEEITDKKCPAVSWLEFETTLNEYALEGLKQVFIVNFHKSLDDLDAFIKENELSYSQIELANPYESMDFYDKTKIDNGYLYLYRNEEDEFSHDVYEFHFNFENSPEYVAIYFDEDLN